MGGQTGGALHMAGGQAYAQYYGKRLPTFEEWNQLRGQLVDSVDPIPVSSAAHPGGNPNPHLEMMKEFSSVTGKLRSENRPVTKEWLSIKTKNGSFSRVVQWPNGGEPQPPVLRYPWEGFSDVGFRSVTDTAGLTDKHDMTNAQPQ